MNLEGKQVVVVVELPGVDPERDISVMVADGELTIGVNRPLRFPGTFDSEFRYGPATRTVQLPSCDGT